MTAAPVAAFGAISYAVGRHGLASVAPLLELLATLYFTSVVFVGLVLGAVARLSGFRLVAFIRYIREEIMLVLGTSSSVTAMPGLIEKMERAGCAKPVAGMVIPSGYSFKQPRLSARYRAIAQVPVADQPRRQRGGNLGDCGVGREARSGQIA